MKKIRFRIAWGQYNKGAIIEPAALLRDTLIRAGVCELVEDVVPTVPPTTPIESAMRTEPETAVRRVRHRGGK